MSKTDILAASFPPSFQNQHLLQFTHKIMSKRTPWSIYSFQNNVKNEHLGRFVIKNGHLVSQNNFKNGHLMR
eukprot:UN27674